MSSKCESCSPQHSSQVTEIRLALSFTSLIERENRAEIPHTFFQAAVVSEGSARDV